MLNGARLAEGGEAGVQSYLGNAYMGENACPDGLEHFSPCPNGQFRVLRGVRTLYQDGLSTVKQGLTYRFRNFLVRRLLPIF